MILASSGDRSTRRAGREVLSLSTQAVPGHRQVRDRSPTATPSVVPALRNTALAAHDGALEDLDPLPGALDHPHVHLDGVAGAEIGDVGAQAVAIDDFSGVHGERP